MDNELRFKLAPRPVLKPALQQGRIVDVRGVPLAASYRLTVGIRPDGRGLVLGANECSQQGLTDVAGLRAVAAGGRHALGLRCDGTLAAYGCNIYGECDVAGWSGIAAIGAMWQVSYGLLRNGHCLAVGDNYYGQCDVGAWRDVASLASGVGGAHFSAVTAAGRCLAVGANYEGQCEVAGWSGVVAVAVGGGFTVGLKADGSVLAVGWNAYGQCEVSSWTSIKAVAATDEASVGLRTDGTLVTAGRNNYGELNVSTWTDVQAIATGAWHTVGIRSDGTVLATGRNQSGECAVSNLTLATSTASLATLRAQGKGVAYGDPEGGELRGPYLTGCAAGRQCYDLFLQKQKTGRLVTLRMQSPYTLCGYSADAATLIVDFSAGSQRLARQGAACLVQGSSGSGLRLPAAPSTPAGVVPCAYTAADFEPIRQPCSFVLGFDYRGDIDYTQGGVVQPGRVAVPLRLAIGAYAAGQAPIDAPAFELSVESVYEEWSEPLPGGGETWFSGWRWHLVLELDGGLYGAQDTRRLRLSTCETSQVDGQWHTHAVEYLRQAPGVDEVRYYVDDLLVSTVSVGVDFGSWSAAIPSGAAKLMAANLLNDSFYTLDSMSVSIL